MLPSNDHDLQKIEIDLLLEGIFLKYGYDFRDYSRAYLTRRILHRLELSGLPNLCSMQHKILREVSFFEMLLLDLSIKVTSMFRDPIFYRAFREKVIPHLHTYPFVKIWHAGCSTGEEVYSMAILLKEEGLYDKTQIYATDFNGLLLKRAQEGTFPVKSLTEYDENHMKAGGREPLSTYVTEKYETAIMAPSLKKNIVFADHNLVTDGVFGEMNLVFCRNVLIYFNRTLQDRVLKLFLDSLCYKGFLCLGGKESIRFSAYSHCFDEVSSKERIYKKK